MVDASPHCIPCRKTDAGLTPQEIEDALNDLPGWKLTESGTAIVRRFSFSNYHQAWTLVNAVSLLAEAENHHPDIRFGWGYAEITFTTHAIGGLHRNDMIMAHTINRLHETNA